MKKDESAVLYVEKKEFDLGAGVTDTESEEETDDSPLDSLRALNKSLCYLAFSKADAVLVEALIMAHPDCLFLDRAAGIHLPPEESARCIVEHQIRFCKCHPAYNENRSAILSLLSRSLKIYRQKARRQENSSRQEAFILEKFDVEDLVPLEREIRGLRSLETHLSDRHYEANIDLRNYKEKLHHLSASSSSPLFSLNRVRDRGRRSRRTDLACKVAASSLNLSSIEREQVDVERKIRHALRTQLSLLQSALDGCKRHACRCMRKKNTDTRVWDGCHGLGCSLPLVNPLSWDL